MRIEDVSKLLRESCESNLGAGKATLVHLFGIKYSDELEGMPLGDVAVGAGIPESYKTEIRKGMNLAAYVRLIELER